MRQISLAFAAAALAAPLPALAQIESVDPDESYAVAGTAETGPATDRLVEKLSDPVVQEQLATTVSVLSEVLLDLPLAPLADALAEAGVESADRIPNDTTLRKLAPQADRVPGEIADKLPQMMGAMASMAKGMEAMMPALKDMATQMKKALPADIATRD